jgi:hypothetical protein
MKSLNTIALNLAAAAAILTLVGCGTSTPAPTPAPHPEQGTIPISISITSTPPHLGASETYQFSATVAKTTDTAVTWSVSGCELTPDSCGSISSGGLFTAPSLVAKQGSVTITATAHADSTKSATSSFLLMPISITLSPGLSVYVAPGAQSNFTAVLDHDPGNAGVTWSLAGTGCSGAACGAFSNVTATGVTYTAPLTAPDPGTVTVTATSVSDTAKSAHTAIQSSPTQPLQEGDYAFLVNGTQGGTSIIAGRFHADGAGNITNGEETANLANWVWVSVPFTGMYWFGNDGVGVLRITTADGTANYRMVVPASRDRGGLTADSESSATPVSGSGHFEPQDPTAFSLTAVSGSYATAFFGWDETDTYDFTSVGRFSAGSDGVLTSGRMDITMLTSLPKNYPDLSLTGSFSAPSATTGRGTATLTVSPKPPEIADTFHFTYYIVSDHRLLLVQTDERHAGITTLAGYAQRQDGSLSLASLDAPAIFRFAGESWFASTSLMGRLVPDGAGGLSGTYDQAECSVIDDIALNQSITGSYAVSSDGRATLNLGSIGIVAYLTGRNAGFAIETNRGLVSIGQFQPQAPGPISADSISGTFLANSSPMRPNPWSGDVTGLVTFTPPGSASASLWTGDSTLEPIGTYSVETNGRGLLTVQADSRTWPLVFWIVSPKQIVAGSTDCNAPPVSLER